MKLEHEIKDIIARYDIDKEHYKSVEEVIEELAKLVYK